MAINESVQYNAGFLPDMILLTLCYILPSGNPIKCHEEVLYSEGRRSTIDAFRFFF